VDRVDYYVVGGRGYAAAGYQKPATRKPATRKRLPENRLPGSQLRDGFGRGVLRFGPDRFGGGGVYEVQSGDTLTGIAAELGTSVEELAAANGITDPDFLSIGQTLYY
jgi:hypothetical protein